MDENQKTCCEISALLDDESQCDLAMQYLRGRGVAKDTDKAIGLLQAVAAKGYFKAQYYLAKFYIKGNYVKKDAAKAYEFLQKSAYQNYQIGRAHV